MDHKQQLKINGFQEYNLNIKARLAMDYNYHKRLYPKYLSQPKNGLYRPKSEHTYITAAQNKYFNKPTLTKQRGTPIYYNLTNPSAYCHLCNLQVNGKPTECLHLNIHGNTKKQKNQSQYFAPEIKTIRNTLLDIRDQMKNRGKKRKPETKRRPYEQEDSESQNGGQYKLNFSRTQQVNNQQKIVEKQRKILQLQQKNQQLSHIIGDLQRKNEILINDLENLEKKIHGLESEIDQHRGRTNRAQNQRNVVLERERALQIKIMDLRADLMGKQQLLRQLNLNQSHHKQNQLAKKLMMRPSQQVSMVVWGSNGYRFERGAQTNLSEVDIENGFRQLNIMQDSLCDKINGNLKIERKIFARIAQIDEKVGFALDKLYEVHQEASKLGINVRAIEI